MQRAQSILKYLRATRGTADGSASELPGARKQLVQALQHVQDLVASK